MFSLKNKIAIVTGGSRGIGKAIIEAYQKAEAIVYNIDKAFGEDVTDYYTMEFRINEIYKSECCIDILVNNAGITTKEGYNNDEWEKVLNVNLKAPFSMSFLQIFLKGILNKPY